MSEIKVNTITKRTGSTLTIGESGATVSLASGASQSGFGRAGSVDWSSTVQTSNFTAVSGNGYFVNTTSGGISVTLPASPSAGDIVAISDYAGTADTNRITILRNSSKIEGAANDTSIAKERQTTTFVYIDSTQGWLPVNSVNEGTDATSPLTYTAEYLVVAGGGAGGGGHRSGGGGAGGYRNSYASETSGRNASTETPLTLTIGSAYTVTVGAGGAVASAANGNRGSDSSISGSGITTVTSNGGGGGGEYQADADAGTYGCGAGCGHQTNATKTGSDGTSGQGFDGGDITVTNAIQQGAAGGGASENGAGGGTTSEARGGAGLASSITGSSVTRAGGGGPGSYGSGEFSRGGVGGGGAGGSETSTDAHSGVSDGSGYFYGVSGTANTGGGGGGAAGPANSTQNGAGGSGVVILRVATANYSGTTSGSPTVTTSGSDTIMVFNASGSYTA